MSYETRPPKEDEAEPEKPSSGGEVSNDSGHYSINGHEERDDEDDDDDIEPPPSPARYRSDFHHHHHLFLWECFSP